MGRWSTLLTLGVALYLVVVNADDCPLSGMEEHSWLIRITPMQKKEDMKEQAPVDGGDESSEGEMLKFNAEYYDNQFDVTQQNPNNRYKREDTKPAEPTAAAATTAAAGTPAAGGGDAKPATPQPTGQSAVPNQPANSTNTSKPGGQGSDPEPGVTVMHGALIAPTKVLTTTYNEYEWMFLSPMQEGYLSLVGYNTEKNCMQEQWAKDAQYHTYASENALNVGEFALIHPHEPFKVEGEPFLFGPSGLPPVADIISAYNTLVGAPDKKVMMYLFKDKTKITDGSTYDPSVTSFKFIPWRLCQDMENLMMAGGKGMSPRVTPETFFCSLGIPGIANETIGGVTTGYGYDYFQGAPVIFEGEHHGKVPIGQYVYRVGKSGDPRIYATYTSKLAKWLQSPSIINPQTLPGQDVGDETAPNVHETATKPGRQAARVQPPPKPGNGGPHFSIAEELWVVLMCAFASATHFA